MGFSRRSIFNMLKDMAAMHNPPIRKVAHGKYEKVNHESPIAHCTTALLEEPVADGHKVDCEQSAIVQSAEVKYNSTNSEEKGN